MVKEVMQEEGITFVIMYAPKHINQILTDKKGEIDTNTITVGNFNIPLTSMGRLSRQIINKETVAFIIKKSTNNKCWRECGEKETFLHCWWECKLIQPLWRTVWRFLKKLKIELPYEPEIPLLGIYSEKTIIQKNTCTPMFFAALFTIARTWKQPKCPSTD